MKEIPISKRTPLEREALKWWSFNYFQFIKDNPEKLWDWSALSMNRKYNM
jgi:hypothetical protein